MKTKIPIHHLPVLSSALVALAAAPVQGDELPIEFKADRTRIENGIAIAEGHVTFTYGTVVIRAQRVDYSPAMRLLRCTGAGEAEVDGVKVALSDFTYDLKTKALTEINKAAASP